MRIAAGLALCLLLAGCGEGEDPVAIGTPTPTAAAAPTASARACLPFSGPPDGSARRPYLKRAMAFECREDVQRLQEALGLPPDGFFDFDTAAAVIARQKPYDCITADDGQVGPQTWALIVEGTHPCAVGSSPAPVPAWARCDRSVAEWALRAVGGTVLRRCGERLVLVHEGTTHTGAVRELGTSVCSEFDESFTAPTGTRTTMCVSDPANDDALQADPVADEGSAIWREEISDRFVGPD